MAKILALFAVAASVATAGTILDPFVVLDAQSHDLNVSARVQVVNPAPTASMSTLLFEITTLPEGGQFFVASDVAVAAVACISGFCPGQNTPGTGPSFSIEDPLTMRLTNTTITCMATFGLCDATLTARFLFNTSLINETEPVSLSVSGSAPVNPGRNFALVVSARAESLDSITHFGSEREISNQLIVPDASGAFNEFFDLGPLLWQRSMDATLTLSIQGLPAGESIFLPGSMDLTIGTVPASNAPEPATLLGAAASVAALVLLRRKPLRAGAANQQD